MDRGGPALTPHEADAAGTSPAPRPTRPLPTRLLLLAVPAVFLAVFFVRPVAAIITEGLVTDGRVDLGGLARVVTTPYVRSVAWFTLWQATLSTVLTLAIGLPGAWVLSRVRFRGRRTIRALVTVPFVLPTVVVGSAFLALLGPRSPLNNGLAAIFGDAAPTIDLRRTVTAILIAHVFFNYSVVVRTVGGLWSHLDPRLEDAARTLGASRWQVLRELTLPLLRPAIASSAAIVFLFTFTSFGVVLLLGGPGVATLEVEIHRATTQLLDLELAAVLALLQLAAVLAALAVYGRLQRATPQRLVSTETGLRSVRARGERWFVRANLTVLVLLLGTPLGVLIERSFSTGDGYGLRNYTTLATHARATVLAVTPLDAIRNSLVFGIAATVVAVVVGGCAAFALTGRGNGARGTRQAERADASASGHAGAARGVAARGAATASRLVDRALMVPLGTSAVTVGFGFLLGLPTGLRTSPAIVPAAQALIAIPFVVRTLVPVLGSIDQRLRDAAAVLGASPRRVWREVDLPIVARSIAVAAGFAFAIAVGEFGATVFVARAEMPTIPVAIFRLLGRPGAANFGQAMALSTILMAITAAALLVIDRLRVGDVGRF